MRWLLVPLLALLLVACGGSGTDAGFDVSDLPSPEPKPKVTYLVDSDSQFPSDPTVSVTFNTPDGTQQGTNVETPLKNKSGTLGIQFFADSGEFLYVSAQNNADHGEVSCVIKIDGVVVSENTSVGGYAIASCEGRMP